LGQSGTGASAGADKQLDASNQLKEHMQVLNAYLPVFIRQLEEPIQVVETCDEMRKSADAISKLLKELADQSRQDEGLDSSSQARPLT